MSFAIFQFWIFVSRNWVGRNSQRLGGYSFDSYQSVIQVIFQTVTLFAQKFTGASKLAVRVTFPLRYFTRLPQIAVINCCGQVCRKIFIEKSFCSSRLISLIPYQPDLVRICCGTSLDWGLWIFEWQAVKYSLFCKVDFLQILVLSRAMKSGWSDVFLCFDVNRCKLRLYVFCAVHFPMRHPPSLPV